MKLSHIKAEHILEAAAIIDHYGPDLTNHEILYWVEVEKGSEYPFKYLMKVANKVALDDENATLDFRSDDTHRNHVRALGFDFAYHKEGFSFFSEHDLEMYSNASGKKYSKGNAEDEIIGRYVWVLTRKINAWAKASCLDDFEYKEDYRWKQPRTINPEQWTVIRAYGSNPQISFFIGVTGEGNLFVKLDYQWTKQRDVDAVSIENQKLIDAYKRDAGYQWLVIPKEQISTYTWDKLVAQTQQHLIQHTSLYWELQTLLDGAVNPKPSIPDTSEIDEDEIGLEPDNIPSKTKRYADRKRTFVGKEVNWERKAAASNKLGFEGEQLVIRYEQKKLRQLDLSELADKVAKQGDGAGYDILSFDKDGNEMHIEVKTTTGDKDEPFYMSIHEKVFLEEHPENYFLYRVYNFSHATKRGRFYCMNSEDVQEITFTPIGFEVSISGFDSNLG